MGFLIFPAAERSRSRRGERKELPSQDSKLKLRLKLRLDSYEVKIFHFHFFFLFLFYVKYDAIGT